MRAPGISPHSTRSAECAFLEPETTLPCIKSEVPCGIHTFPCRTRTDLQKSATASWSARLLSRSRLANLTARPTASGFRIPFPARAAKDCRTPGPADRSAKGFNAATGLLHRIRPPTCSHLASPSFASSPLSSQNSPRIGKQKKTTSASSPQIHSPIEARQIYRKKIARPRLMCN